MNTAAHIAEDAGQPKSADLDSEALAERVCVVASSYPGRAHRGGRLVALHEGLDAAGDPAALADCIEAIAARADKAAFATLFSYFAPRLKAYLVRLGLETAQAEEVAQDVMVTVWRKAASYDRRQASASTWIFRIARNRRIDVFRRERRADLDAHDPGLRPTAEPTPDAVAEAGQLEVNVREAMARLPPDQRDLVRAAFYEDLSHSQIAERTGIPLGTVKSRLRQAFGKLRGCLNADRIAGVDA